MKTLSDKIYLLSAELIKRKMKNATLRLNKSGEFQEILIELGRGYSSKKMNMAMDAADAAGLGWTEYSICGESIGGTDLIKITL